MGHGHKPADIYPALLKAFNAGDIDAILACYEPQARFVLKSGDAVRGAVELREMFRATLSYKPDLVLEIRKIIPATDDLALVVVEWKTKMVSSSGEAQVSAGTATDIVRRQAHGTWKIVLDVPYGVE